MRRFDELRVQDLRGYIRLNDKLEKDFNHLYNWALKFKSELGLTGDFNHDFWELYINKSSQYDETHLDDVACYVLYILFFLVAFTELTNRTFKYNTKVSLVDTGHEQYVLKFSIKDKNISEALVAVPLSFDEFRQHFSNAKTFLDYQVFIAVRPEKFEKAINLNKKVDDLDDTDFDTNTFNNLKLKEIVTPTFRILNENYWNTIIDILSI